MTQPNALTAASNLVVGIQMTTLCMSRSCVGNCICANVTRVEHRRRIAKRGTECPFFTARITELPEKKTIRKIASKASLQTPKLTRTRSTKATNPEPDSDDREENLGRSTRSRATKATKTPARAPIRNAAASRSREPSVAETDEPSESDAVEVTKPKAKGSKRKPKARTPIVEEEDESEAAPPRKSTRAKKIKGGFEDVEMDVNFEELKPRRAQPPRSTRSRSKAPTEGSDSDASVKSVRSTRSTRSNRGTSAQSKKKVVEEETEEEMATPVQKPKKTTRSMAPPKSTKGRKPEREESIESESSGLLPTPPPKPPRSARKSQRKIIESESEEWQSAREDVAPTPRPSTTKKARGRPPKVAKTPKAPPKPTPVPPSPTPISDVSHVSGSYMSESELHIPVRDGSSKASKPSTKSAAQPFHEKPSNRDRALAESRTQPLTSSRLPSTGSKENTEDRNAIIIDASDDEDDARRFVASKSMMPSSNPSKIHNGSTNGGPKLKTTLAQKRDSFIGVVLEPSPRMRRLSAKVGGNVVERPEVDMDVDEVTTLDQPSRSVETDRDSPVVVEKGKVKTMAKPEPLSSTSEHKQRADIRSEVTDSAMDVDDGNGHEVRDGRSIRDSRQPSTPRRDPPARFFRDDSNPFATGQANPVEAANPLSAFGAGNLPAEVLYALVEEEKDMTVEEWTKRESEIQLELFKEHGLRRLLEFKEKAAEVRRQIEAL